MSNHPESTPDRIQLLERFREALETYFHGSRDDDDRQAIKSLINRNLMAAKNLVLEAGTLRLMNLAPPTAVGGMVMSRIDPFDMIFQSYYGLSLIPDVVDMVEQAIGVYQHLQDETGFIRLSAPEIIDLENAITRSLRPAFRNGPPTCERDVQDAVENIMITLGLDYVRDSEVAHVGAKGFKPDFTIEEQSLAIEVKLATEKHGIKKIQEEIAADISGYKTKWKRLLVIIYDLAVIEDPHRFRQEHIKHFGVSVVIVKH